jgi:superfamily I DNA/RNA helicase
VSVEPSRYQQAIYDHVVEHVGRLVARKRGRDAPPPRHLAVEAGPGSGKSHTVREVCSRIPNATVDVVSFTERVARDAAQRLPSNAQSLTLHSAGFRAIQRFMGRRYRKAAEQQEGDGELAPDKTRRIVFGLKRKGLVDQYLPAGLVAKLVDAAKAAGVVPDGAAVGVADPQPVTGLLDDSDATWAALAAHHGVVHPRLRDLFGAARRVLRRSLESSTAIVDFGDMVYLAAVLDGIEFYQRDVVAVDELQDLDPVQRRVVVRMVTNPASPALFLGVGDPDQAVFSWRGAEHDAMARMVSDLGCAVLPLSVCYRCPESHVAMARTLVPRVEPRPGAPAGRVVSYGPPPPEAAGVDVEHESGAPEPGDFLPGDAVVCRTNAPLVRMAYWLMQARVRVRVVGRDFGRGLSATVQGTGARTADDALHALEERLRASTARDARDPSLEGEASEATVRLRDACEVVAAIVEVLPPGAAVEALASDVDHLFVDDGSADAVTLSSIHRAKGGEWDRVWWLDHAGCVPRRGASSWQEAEVRHLRYIALTRARDTLIFLDKALVA